LLEEEKHTGKDLSLLFITRKFPPSKGGMESVAHELYTHISKLSNVRLISYGGSNKFLPLVLPLLFIRASWNLLIKKIDVVYLQDGLLSPLGVVLKMSGKPVAITIHGLDITYKNRFYQYLIPKCIKRLDKIICISNATKEECIKRGILEEKITIIPNGISDDFYINEDKAVLKERLAERINLSLNGRKILLSVGRLVERKGIHWFVENVIPKLLERDEEFKYLIAGDGILRPKIQNIILENKLKNNVVMLGKVEDETLKLLYNTADILVMPNITVDGDMEGFGVVALEAASCGVPVVASELEGIKDAVKQGENGFLVESYNDLEIMKVITRLLIDNEEREEFRKIARKFTLEKYGWKAIAETYIGRIGG
jgi:glycosyltransferase involved in cell wall biosynthesis